VNITSATQLLLSDRAAAVLGNFTPGDVINVYGYYDGNGSIQGQVVRDLSKPAAPGLAAPTTTTAPIGSTTTAPLSVPTTPVVGPNPTSGQLLQILQTLLIQVQGVLTQLIQMSGTTPTGVGQAPMIPASSTTPSSTSTL
jgi:hypothetical protein